MSFIGSNNVYNDGEYETMYRQKPPCCKCRKISPRRTKTKKKTHKEFQMPPDMFTSYEPCVHLHFKTEQIDRDCLTHEQYLDYLATPKGYRWLGEVDCQNPELDINKKKKKKPPKRQPQVIRMEGGDFAEEFVEDMWDVMSPDITDRLIDFLVNEFGMSMEEAEDFIDCRSTVGKQTVCKKKKSKAILGLGPRRKWVKEFSDVFAKRIEQYIVSMLMTRRTPRVKRIAEKILEYLCALTGEQTTLQNPKTKIQRIMVLISDRLALWIDDLMKDIDKPVRRPTITEHEEESEKEEPKDEEPEEEEPVEEKPEEKKPEKEEEPPKEEPEKDEGITEEPKPTEEEPPPEKEEPEEGDKEPAPEEPAPEEEEKAEVEEEPQAEPEKEPEAEPEKEPEPEPETEPEKEPEPEPEKEPEKEPEPEKVEETAPEEAEPESEAKPEDTEPTEAEPESQIEDEKEEKAEPEETEPTEAAPETADEEQAEEAKPEDEQIKSEEEDKLDEPEETEEKEPEEEMEEEVEEEVETKPTEEPTAEEPTPKEPSEIPSIEEKEERKVEPEKLQYGDILDLVKQDIAATPKERRTDRQKAVKDVIDRRIEKILAGKELTDEFEQEDFDDAVSKVAHWVDHIIGATERIKEPVARISPGGAFEVQAKTGSTLQVHKLSSGTVAQITAEARGVEVPPRQRKIPASVSPMNSKSAQEWVDWATNIATIGDEWGKWLESTLTDAEKRIVEKKEGKAVGAWNDWREKAKTEAVKWRVEKERIKDEGKLWGRKLDEKLKIDSEIEMKSTELSQ